MADFEMNCPHCNAKISVQDEWVGIEVSCPFCSKTFTVAANTTAVDTPPPPQLHISPSVPKSGGSVRTRDPFFTFICPTCGTQAKLQSSQQGQNYECKACREISIAEPASVKICPHCGQTINFNATICKYCKNNVNEAPVQSAPTTSSYPFDVTPILKERAAKRRRKLLTAIGLLLAVALGMGIYFGHRHTKNKRAANCLIPLLPELEEKCPFSWENATKEIVTQWAQEKYPGKYDKSDFILHDDGTTILSSSDDIGLLDFSFDSTDHLTMISCLIDLDSAGDYVRKFDKKYGEKKTEELNQTTIYSWEDKESPTRISLCIIHENGKRCASLSVTQLK